MNDMGLLCFGPEHSIVTLAIGVPTVLILCLFIPWYQHVRIYHAVKATATFKDRTPSYMVTQQYGLCSLPFESQYWHYFNLVLVSKIAVAGCAALMAPGATKFQAYAGMIVLNVALLLHFRQQPFYHDDADELQSNALMIAQGAVAGLALGDDIGGAGQTFVVLAIFVCQIGFAVRGAMLFRRNSPININNKGSMEETRVIPDGLGGESDHEGDEKDADEKPKNKGEVDLELNAVFHLDDENAPLSPQQRMEKFDNQWEKKISKIAGKQDAEKKQDEDYKLQSTGLVDVAPVQMNPVYDDEPKSERTVHERISSSIRQGGHTSRTRSRSMAPRNQSEATSSRAHELTAHELTSSRDRSSTQASRFGHGARNGQSEYTNTETQASGLGLGEEEQSQASGLGFGNKADSKANRSKGSRARAASPPTVREASSPSRKASSRSEEPVESRKMTNSAPNKNGKASFSKMTFI